MPARPADDSSASDSVPFAPTPRRRFLRRTLGVAAGAIVASVGGLTADAWASMGANPAGARLERIRRSPNYVGGRFRNTVAAQERIDAGMVREWLGGDAVRSPVGPVPTVAVSAAEAARPSTETAVRWLGHATLLVEIGGRRLLTDPLFGERAGPGRLLGPARFSAPPLARADLPPLDAVVITHDHYDHLSEPTIRALADRVPRFVVPLGVGAHLERWGVAPDRITELDWWESADVGGVTVTATPARHFSGRGLRNRDSTLWCGYALSAPALGDRPAARLYLGGDSGYGPHFAEIGARLGPFDLALVEIGAYNRRWPDVHMGPEQAVRAVRDVRAAAMLPVHWATYTLALHGWTEPGERVIVAAAAAGVPLVLPRPGARVAVGEAAPVARWWPPVPWQTAAESPIVSSGTVPPGSGSPGSGSPGSGSPGSGSPGSGSPDAAP